ncbi:hypothetical protein GDO78_023295 [Eleutherodactylus coqui]|uniref:Uncharacterized protein n=1 Tax=Eleutherodactylus coqui TaxID=57060 RepID=A0A8J6BD18_ELECQ|nr:hypothetical protein GDO78_023295 [Eleutherodactylus coqui]
MVTPGRSSAAKSPLATTADVGGSAAAENPPCANRPNRVQRNTVQTVTPEPWKDGCAAAAGSHICAE